jgi:hypothetical protein
LGRIAIKLSQELPNRLLKTIVQIEGMNCLYALSTKGGGFKTVLSCWSQGASSAVSISRAKQSDVCPIRASLIGIQGVLQPPDVLFLPFESFRIVNEATSAS